jgi:hypothetical protein
MPVSDKHLAAQNQPRSKKQRAAIKQFRESTWNASRHLREQKAKPPAGSWWQFAPAAGFTARAVGEEPRMRRASIVYVPFGGNGPSLQDRLSRMPRDYVVE